MVGWFRRSGRVTAETARRVTGISTPLGGIQWGDPGPSEMEIVRRLILFLEDRRALYKSHDLEVAAQVDRSVEDIRSECTNRLQELPPKAFAVTPIRAIRAACRRYHDDRQEDFRFFQQTRPYFNDSSPGFFAALGSLRASIGYQVALLAAHYDIDVEGDLASVLPALDDSVPD